MQCFEALPPDLMELLVTTGAMTASQLRRLASTCHALHRRLAYSVPLWRAIAHRSPLYDWEAAGLLHLPAKSLEYEAVYPFP